MVMFFTNDKSIANHELRRIKYLYPSMMVKILLFIYEIIQLISEKRQYFFDLWNMFDMMGSVFFWMLCYNDFSKTGDVNYLAQY